MRTTIPVTIRRLGLAGIVVLVASLSCVGAEKAQKTPGKAAKSPERWEATIRKFEADDAAKPPAKGGIVLVGGSNARRWTDVADYFPGEVVLNRGFGGARLSEVVHYWDRLVKPYAPKTIILNAGGNDLTGGGTLEELLANCKAFMAKTRAALPQARVYYIAIPPVMRTAKSPEALAGVKKVNDMLAAYAEKDAQLEFIDIFPAFLGADGKPKAEMYVEDGTHFTPKGYAAVAALLRERMTTGK